MTPWIGPYEMKMKVKIFARFSNGNGTAWQWCDNYDLLYFLGFHNCLEATNYCCTVWCTSFGCLLCRALDNQVYVATASPARDETASYVAWGHSTVVNPWYSNNQEHVAFCILWPAVCDCEIRTEKELKGTRVSAAASKEVMSEWKESSSGGICRQ